VEDRIAGQLDDLFGKDWREAKAGDLLGQVEKGQFNAFAALGGDRGNLIDFERERKSVEFTYSSIIQVREHLRLWNRKLIELKGRLDTTTDELDEAKLESFPALRLVSSLRSRTPKALESRMDRPLVPWFGKRDREMSNELLGSWRAVLSPDDSEGSEEAWREGFKDPSRVQDKVGSDKKRFLKSKPKKATVDQLVLWESYWKETVGGPSIPE
jgi:hypothetical protein